MAVSVPWLPGASPTALCIAAGQPDVNEYWIDGGVLWINGVTQAAADAAREANPPHVLSPAARAALDALCDLDRALPRCMEDLIAGAGIPVSSLPQVMQERLAAKAAARTAYKAG